MQEISERPAHRLGLFALTAVSMAAFAGNSLLCRSALANTSIDPATFTTVRLLSGAAVLWMLVRARGAADIRGDWLSAFALFAYAAAFSFAYVSLSAGTGALLLFGAVQATMIGRALYVGERFKPTQWLGLLAALAGLIYLLSPGLSAPPLIGAVLMTTAGVAWGVYSLRGRGAGDPTQATAGNFLRAAPMTLMLSALWFGGSSADVNGVLLAVASGALTSGLGYAIWYTAVRELKAASAATVQLSVPALTALSGVVLLDEPLTVRIVIASTAILGGIALVITRK